MVGVNVVLEGQRCADELILGMSRRAWRQVQSPLVGRGEEEGGGSGERKNLIFSLCSENEPPVFI